MAKDRAILTVVGIDQVGIIARVSTYLYENNVNIEDITQSIVSGFFNMMIIVDTSDAKKPFLTLVNELEELGKNIGAAVKLQREEIFKSMQRI